MFAQVAGIDPARVRVGASMAVRMLRNQGVGGGPSLDQRIGPPGIGRAERADQ